MYDIFVSIVLYNPQESQVIRAVDSILNTNLKIKLYLIDNSPQRNILKLPVVDSRVEYIFVGKNLGYGRANNIAIRESIESKTPFHLVMNPDVYFKGDILEKIYTYMSQHKEVGLLMPKVLYPNGNLQYLCKLLPTPLDLFGRRFLNFGPFKRFLEKRNKIYELRFTGYNEIMEVPYLSGCFMFIKVDVLKKIGLFDERFFMYMEDVDLSRRIYRVAKNIYFPHVYIYHEYGKGSYKDLKLLYHHINSAIKYFNKWGWFNDPERERINKEVLEKLGYKLK